MNLEFGTRRTARRPERQQPKSGAEDVFSFRHPATDSTRRGAKRTGSRPGSCTGSAGHSLERQKKQNRVGRVQKYAGQMVTQAPVRSIGNRALLLRHVQEQQTGHVKDLLDFFDGLWKITRTVSCCCLSVNSEHKNQNHLPKCDFLNWRSTVL